MIGNTKFKENFNLSFLNKKLIGLKCIVFFFVCSLLSFSAEKTLQ